jgi:lysophospholipase L1-like esterase
MTDLPFRRWSALIAGVLLLLCACPHAEAARSPQHQDEGAWREAFQSSPAATDLRTDAEFQAFADRLRIPPNIVDMIRPLHVSGTVRYRLAVSAGGSKLQLRISNELGQAPLELAAVTVGLATDAFDAVPGSIKAVTFGGNGSVLIPPGAPVLSDPVDVKVASGAAVLVSLRVPDDFILTRNGGSALAVASGDQTRAGNLDGATMTTGRPIVTGISVFSPGQTRVVVALGDSITDGNRPVAGALHSWPEQLARRLAARGGRMRYAVSNAGISGNRLLQPGVAPEMGSAGLARLDRDVLRIDGLGYVVLLEGTNDIGVSGHTLFGDNPAVTVDDLVAGYRQVIGRAHARGARVIVGTILPFGGSPSHSSPEKEALRQQVNRWIRTSGEPDGVADFDAALRDAADPARMQERFDSGDHLHPNEAGSLAMGDAFDLALFN